MKKEQRLVFLELSSEVESSLCSFCKYHEAAFYSAGKCKHPLADRTRLFPISDDPLEPGDDCWGFRNAMNASDCADIVGIILANGWEEWMYCLYPDKRIEVSGRKEAQ